MTSPNPLCFTLIMKTIFSFAFIIGLSHSKLLDNKPRLTSLKALCDNTLYPNTCYDTLSPRIDYENNLYDSQFLYNVSVQVAMDEIARVHAKFTDQKGISLTHLSEDTADGNNLTPLALESCRDFLSLALYNLNWSTLPTSGGGLTISETRTNFRTWLSAAAADLETCRDDFKYAPDEITNVINSYLDNATKLVETSLAIISKIDDYMSSHTSSDQRSISDWEPTWLSSKDTKLINKAKQAIKPDVVVAQDGSGKYRTIGEAINAAPHQSDRRFIIYVKKGVYRENVVVEKEKWNVLVYGDGMRNTIVTSNRSNHTGAKTSHTATFAAYGKGFIAKDIGFRNSAGPWTGQAVALLSASDQSVFYRCLIDGYQDTLFAQSHRQFYRECQIYGTIDFIFGDGAIVIQNSNILVRRPLHSSSAMVTAQGRMSPHSNSGISIQKCSIEAAENLGRVRTFLGRPWKSYSTVVVMQSRLGSLIDPAGWLPWGKSTTAPDTVFYVEYGNVGPGAATSKRVGWKGLRINAEEEARKFTVRSFINGDRWLPSTGVPFQADL